MSDDHSETGPDAHHSHDAGSGADHGHDAGSDAHHGHDAGSGPHHHDAGSDAHHGHDAETVTVGVLTVSSSRTLETDDGGNAVVTALESAGHGVAVRDIVTDDETAIRDRVETVAGESDAVVTTGGTGLTADDVTPEAVVPLFDREIPGFGEQFRARSVDEVGPHGMLSRATAGVADGTPIFCLPGSEQAARMGTRDLVVPILGHVVGLTDGSHGDNHD